jgi:type I restriction enzyme R subunit
MTERSAVQNPMLKYAREIGWEYVRPEDALRLRGGDTGLYFADVLEERLLRLNQDVLDRVILALDELFRAMLEELMTGGVRARALIEMTVL